MASKDYYFSGEAKWAMLFAPDKEYKNYKITVNLDEPSKVKYLESGLQGRPKTDDGGFWVTFRRPETKEIKGDLKRFEKPKVVNDLGEEVTDFVGNGSKVTVRVTVYDTRRGKGHRLEAVRVDELVKYVSDKESEHSKEEDKKLF